MQTPSAFLATSVAEAVQGQAGAGSVAFSFALLCSPAMTIWLRRKLQSHPL